MLVIELANNAQKHVFQYGRGSRLAVTLTRLSADQVALTVSDDGPGPMQQRRPETAQQGLGLDIVQGLVAQLRGTLRTTANPGTTVVIEFPVG